MIEVVTQTRPKPGESRSAQAYRLLRQQILDNDLPPGTQMLEQEVADRLGISRTPVREALIRLAEEKLVEVRPRHGMRVLPVSAVEMDEIYEVLTSLELTAIERLIAAEPDESAFSDLERAVSDMEMALESDDRKTWAEADSRFHALLVELAGNQRLSAIVAALQDQSHRARMTTLALRPMPQSSNRDHRALVAAIRRGDRAAACKMHRAHRDSHRELLCSILTGLQGKVG